MRIFEGTDSLNGGMSEIPPRIIDDRPAEKKVLILDLSGIKAKVENRGQYDQYLAELAPLREELGVSLKEDLYPEEAK